MLNSNRLTRLWPEPLLTKYWLWLMCNDVTRLKFHTVFRLKLLLGNILTHGLVFFPKMESAFKNTSIYRGFTFNIIPVGLFWTVHYISSVEWFSNSMLECLKIFTWSQNQMFRLILLVSGITINDSCKCNLMVKTQFYLVSVSLLLYT